MADLVAPRRPRLQAERPVRSMTKFLRLHRNDLPTCARESAGRRLAAADSECAQVLELCDRASARAAAAVRTAGGRELDG